jgi:hypothetical protein
VPVVGKSDAEVREVAERWRALGATQVTIDPRAVSLHVDQDITMDEKIDRQRSSATALIEHLTRGYHLVAGV